MADDRPSNRRFFSRVETQLPVRLRAPGKQIDGRVIDLSLGGALVTIEDMVDSGERVELSLPLSGGPTGRLSSTVRRVVRSRGVAIVGLEFDPLETSQRDKIRGHLSSRLPPGAVLGSRALVDTCREAFPDERFVYAVDLLQVARIARPSKMLIEAEFLDGNLSDLQEELARAGAGHVRVALVGEGHSSLHSALDQIPATPTPNFLRQSFGLPTRPVFAGRRIAVCGDQPDCEAVARMLEGEDADVVHTATGSQLLETLSAEKADVVVLHGASPSINPAALLDRIRRASPQSSVVLLGNASEAVPLLDLIGSRFDGYFRGRNRMLELVRAAPRLSPRGGTGGEVRSRGDEKLADPPATLASILAYERDPGSNAATMAFIIQRDNDLAAAMLSLAKQKANVQGQPIQDLKTAVTRLGYRFLANTALTHVTTPLYRSAVPGLRPALASLRARSIAVAVAARFVAASHQVEGERAYAAGLLMDLGKPLVLVRHTTAGSPEDGAPLVDSEVWSAVGRDHSDLGGALLRAWKLDDEVIALAEHHHDPPGQAVPSPLLSGVTLSRRLATRLGYSTPDAEPDRPFRLPDGAELDVDRLAQEIADALETWGLSRQVARPAT
jgi:HD-like signal output (HDOD) protein